ncbi:hypothetical protein ACT2X2_004486 [Citrobacter freundii]|jgi:hypothetical protein|uniref:hypothetical protein n=1 Tax=Enterobacteriaceae TaxID=543 RepID=UPI000CB924C2|nr:MULTISPECIES: hypothetical protein [Enterobacteriaceae]EHF8252288.1 hypothetical protein [Enterobacter roggenkampii]OZO83811.1 hypothetical protein CG700_11555 [Escherichia coli]HAL0942536.1 hypothetical protein [Escherichia coli]HCL5570061.1 hypothetical protein [Citrobacter freundii]HED3087681.1 hypothetical protein [Citrobacter freundii]
MFKLLITLINHEAGDRRELVHNGRYKTREAAWKDAQKMAYIHKNAIGAVTHECIVKIAEAGNV